MMVESEAPSRGRIFISYRRQETAAYSGWLYDRLAVRYPSEVFKDACVPARSGLSYFDRGFRETLHARGQKCSGLVNAETLQCEFIAHNVSYRVPHSMRA